MALFTQGLWIVNPTHARVDVMREDVGIQPICELLWPTSIRSEAETEANADLIAAAPMMYELLDGLENDNGCIPIGYWDKIQAVLAKARGEA